MMSGYVWFSIRMAGSIVDPAYMENHHGSQQSARHSSAPCGKVKAE